MKNLLREKLLQGGHALGTFYELGGIAAAQCIGIAGMDFAIVDTEHGPADVESALTAITALSARNCTPLVRVKDVTRPSVLKMLDVGARGLVVPDVQTVDEVRRLVEYAKYYPLGRRGFAPTLSGGYGFDPECADTQQYFDHCNRETMLIPQCETLGALEHIEEIAAMEGVDGIFVGPYDLSVALGKPAQMDDPDLQAAIDRVLSACKKHGKCTMIYAGDAAGSAAFFRRGFDCVACGMDSIFLIQALRTLRADVDKQMG